MKPKQVIKLSNLINDCVVMVQQAGQLVQQTNNNMNGMSSALAVARRATSAASPRRDQSIADVDF